MVFDKPIPSKSGEKPNKKDTGERRVRFSPHVEVLRYELEAGEKRGTRPVPSPTSSPIKSTGTNNRRWNRNLHSDDEDGEGEDKGAPWCRGGRRRRGKKH